MNAMTHKYDTTAPTLPRVRTHSEATCAPVSKVSALKNSTHVLVCIHYLYVKFLFL